jgi:hypothetical protein
MLVCGRLLCLGVGGGGIHQMRASIVGGSLLQGAGIVEGNLWQGPCIAGRSILHGAGIVGGSLCESLFSSNPEILSP